jgi:hypothetical protein
MSKTGRDRLRDRLLRQALQRKDFSRWRLMDSMVNWFDCEEAEKSLRRAYSQGYRQGWEDRI